MKQSIIDHYRSLSYGLFIHMGLYSELAGFYKGKPTPFYSEWIRLSLDIPAEDYHQLTEKFRPDSFDAKDICRRAKQWGMKYVCFTSKHHDGFAMFDTKTDEFNSWHHLGRDFVAELAQACREEDLMFGLYYSQAQDWEHPGGLRAYQDPPPKDLYQKYLTEKALVQLEELLTNYGPIGYLWLDTPTGMPKEDGETIAQLIRRLQPDCLIGGRIGHGLGDVIITGDNRLPRLALDQAWELPATLNSSWGYCETDEDWRTPEEIIHQLSVVVSRGGNLLLNIGPDGQGRIPQGSLDTLNAVGKYLQDRQDAFYTNQMTPDYPYEQSDFLLTSAPHKLYIHLIRDPNRERVELYHLENKVKSARILGSNQAVDLFVGQDLEGHAYWRLTLPDAISQDIIEVSLVEEKVKISSLK